MSERDSTTNTYFVPLDQFLIKQAQQRVILENGCLATPAYQESVGKNQRADSDKSSRHDED